MSHTAMMMRIKLIGIHLPTSLSGMFQCLLRIGIGKSGLPFFLLEYRSRFLWDFYDVYNLIIVMDFGDF